MKILEKIKECGIIPVVVIEDAGEAQSLARAILDGGLNCVEITFRTKEAAKALEQIKKEFPDMVVGAGTVLTTKQVDVAVEAGAQFIVCPGSDLTVIEYCQKNHICIIPGVMTPSEIEKNLKLGITTMKFFPAEAAGGLKMIQALAAPYRNVKFMPTGGITAENVRAYLKCNCVIACGGSWMVKSTLIEEKNYTEITRRSKEAADIVKEVR